MATEWAVLQHGEIVNVITASERPDELLGRFPDCILAPLDSLPLAVREQYRYWDERP